MMSEFDEWVAKVEGAWQESTGEPPNDYELADLKARVRDELDADSD